MRNNLGQEIKIGSPVVLVTQGQGWTNIGVGRVSSLKKVPVVTYLNGEKSSGVQRWERLLVISDREFESHRRRYELFIEIEEYYWTNISNVPKGNYWKSYYSQGRWGSMAAADFRGFMDYELNRRGEEPWYA